MLRMHSMKIQTVIQKKEEFHMVCFIWKEM
nr:MAG TPA: hypothetical protein [Caudoviricetes sp.]